MISRSGTPSIDELEIYLAAFFPRMPAEVRHEIIGRFKRSPKRGRLPEIAGIVTSNYARHRFTDYEAILRATPHHRNDDEQRISHRGIARKAVAKRLCEVIDEWTFGAPIHHPELVALRKIHREKKIRASGQNAALAEFSRRWISGHFETIESWTNGKRL
ncbi:MAG: DUF2293 domain-containing protein [Xanthobacteraceae bacterium]|jgi:hypothetical protein